MFTALLPVLFIAGGLVVVAFVLDRRRTQGGPAPIESPDAGGAGFAVAARPFACTVCQGTSFDQREAQLNTAVATFFNFDWANASATCLVCRRCGYVHWFLPTG